MKKHINSIILIIAFIFICFPSSALATGKQIDRISGKDRFETAVEVSKRGWPTGTDTIVLAVNDNFPDALSGAPLAYSLDAPILLTSKTKLPDIIKKEITRLGAKKAIILGGEQVISTTIFKELEGMGILVERISGQNRYHTSVEIAKRLGTSSNTAVVTYGKNFPDSLSVASIAARNGYPIFLTNSTELPVITRKALESYSNTIVVGGEGVINADVFNKLPNPKRIAGEDRYRTGVNVLEQLDPNLAKRVVIATGESFADALTGSVLAAKLNSSILLVSKNSIPTSVKTYLDLKNFEHFTVIGGVNVIPDDIITKLSVDTDKLVSHAKSLIGTPYLWAGTTPSGFDCSGYLNYVYAKSSVSLPRTTESIWSYGVGVSTPQIGDIVFFETYKPGPSHAGIYLGNGEFIHASTSKGVTISNLGETYYKTRYLGAKKVF